MELGASSVSLAVADMAASRTFYERVGFAMVTGDGESWVIMASQSTVFGLFHGMFESNILTFNPARRGSALRRARSPTSGRCASNCKRGIECSGDAPSGPASLSMTDPRWQRDPHRPARLTRLGAGQDHRPFLHRDRGSRMEPMSTTGTTTEADAIAWLMEGDPAIRWQVLRDLLDAPDDQWRAEQDLVATDGWGARLLACCDGDGRWTPRLYGKKWISTTYSMVLLRRLGLPRDDPGAQQSCQLFLDEALREDGGIDPSVSLGRSETCVTGLVLGLLSWFSVPDPRREPLVEYLLTEQMPDGGWNCERDRGATHSSFHTTTNVLEGLREYAAGQGVSQPDVLAAEARAQEFLCVHGLYRSHHTGEIVDARMTRLSFPPRWRHDVLRGLDYFRSANAEADDRLADAVALVESKRGGDGRWPLQQRHPGATWFEMETVGEASRWNTLRALRVLRWWHASPPLPVGR